MKALGLNETVAHHMIRWNYGFKMKKEIESTCFTRNCCSGLVSKPARQVAEDGEVEGEAEEEGGR